MYWEVVKILPEKARSSSCKKCTNHWFNIKKEKKNHKKQAAHTSSCMLFFLSPWQQMLKIKGIALQQVFYLNTSDMLPHKNPDLLYFHRYNVHTCTMLMRQKSLFYKNVQIYMYLCTTCRGVYVYMTCVYVCPYMCILERERVRDRQREVGRQVGRV